MDEITCFRDGLVIDEDEACEDGLDGFLACWEEIFFKEEEV